MNKAKIYINDVFCGVLVENSEGYFFQYDTEYLKRLIITNLEKLKA